MSKFDELGVKIGNAVINYRWVVLLALVLSFAAMGFGATKLGFDTNYRTFFSDENPQLRAFDELQMVYTKTDNITFVLKPKKGDIFQPNVLKAVKDLTEESWKLPNSTRVDSLSNYQYTYAEGDDLIVTDLIYDDPLTYQYGGELRILKEVVLEEPLLMNKIVSSDLATTGVNITFYMDESDVTQVPITAQAARKLLAKFQAEYPEIEMKASGVVMMNNSFSEASQMDMMTLMPLMFAMIVLSMLIFLRNISCTVATLFVVVFSAAAAMGLAGWFGVKLTPPSASAPIVILTLAIADSIHVIVTMFKSMQEGLPKREAIIESLRINFQPIFLTSLTTAIGFLSLNFSDAPPFHDLGNIIAAGVVFAFIYSITLLPILLYIMPIKIREKQQKQKSEYTDKLASFVIGKRKVLLPISAVIVVFLGAMMTKIELNDQFVEYFDHSIPFRGDTEFMMDNLTGIYQIEYSVRAHAPQGVNDPEYLNKLEEFSMWLRAQPETENVYTMTDIYKRLNKNMHGDEQSWYKIPEEREMAAQYLLLYEFSLPFGLDLNDRINVDKSATRITVTLKNMSTNEIKEFKNRGETWLEDNAPEYMQTEGTSPVVMFAYISERNIKSMMTGSIIALFLISLSIMFALRSFRIGMYSLIPNLVPAVMGFGIWGLLVGQVNMAVAIIAAISLGIIVDDTVHFLSKYLRARREKNMSAEDAVRYSFNTVGSALIITTFILVIGFAVLIFSGFELNKSMGMLTAITIACALVADFFLLPPMLMLLDKNKEKK